MIYTVDYTTDSKSTLCSAPPGTRRPDTPKESRIFFLRVRNPVLLFLVFLDILPFSLDGGNSVLVVGIHSRLILRLQKIEQELHFLKRFGHFRDIPAKSRDISPKSLISLVSRDISNFLAPTPSRGRPLPTGKYPDSKVWVCALISWPSFEASKTQPFMALGGLKNSLD